MILLLCLRRYMSRLLASQITSEHLEMLFRLGDDFTNLIVTTGPLLPTSLVTIPDENLWFRDLEQKMHCRSRYWEVVSVPKVSETESTLIKCIGNPQNDRSNTHNTQFIEVLNIFEKIMNFHLLAQIWRTFLEPKPPKKISWINSDYDWHQFLRKKESYDGA